MSYTEIYKFNKKGNAEDLAEVKNAWRGAMAIWNIMDERYLPPFIPEWAKRSEQPLQERYHRSADMGDDGLKLVWKLSEDPKIPETDRIALMSTYDNVIVLKEDLPKLIKAFRKFEGETSLKNQADIFEKVLNDKDLIAVGWNQTSVNCDTWMNFGGYTKKDKPISYNILKMKDRHWSLFEELKTINESITK